MAELIVHVPKEMPISKQISTVGKKLSEWIESLEKPIVVGQDVIYLSGWHVNGECSYKYTVERGASH